MLAPFPEGPWTHAADREDGTRAGPNASRVSTPSGRRFARAVDP